jgi:tetratricopeptide (TPR) repeat protein
MSETGKSPELNAAFAHHTAAMDLERSGALEDACAEYLVFADAVKQQASGEYLVFCLNWAGNAMRQAGNLYLHSLGQPEKAADCYAMSTECYRATHAVIDEAASTNNRGDALEAQGELDKALVCYEEACSLLGGLPYGRGHSITLYNTGRVHFARQRYFNAHAAMKKGFSLAIAGGDQQWVAQFRSALETLNGAGIAVEDDASGLEDSAARVLQMERDFAGAHGRGVSDLCQMARQAGHIAQKGLAPDELEAVRRVPVTSFPLISPNAQICRLSSGGVFINFGPELLVAFHTLCESHAKLALGRISVQDFVNEVGSTLLRISEGTVVLGDAMKLTLQFLGRGTWQFGTGWVALHEYGHYLLGHLSQGQWVETRGEASQRETITTCSITSHQMELAADAFATKRCLQALSEIGGSVAQGVMNGAGAALGLISIARAAAGQPTDDRGTLTHPPTDERLEAIKRILIEECPEEASGVSAEDSSWRLCSSLQMWRLFAIQGGGSGRSGLTLDV